MRYMDGRTALIGHTGFVGGVLARDLAFDDCYNSSNIDDLAGRSYDLVICAGVSAAKWIANQDPDGDRARIERLTDALGQAQIHELVLISTIDVYPDPRLPSDETTPINPGANHAYGANRFALEQWAQERFPNLRIIRLPALFGEGLRKNALYDLLNDNDPQAINPLNSFQWYPTCRLSEHIGIVRRAGLSLVNLFTEPLAMGEIIRAFFPHSVVGPERAPALSYDVRTRYAELFGGANGYIYDSTLTLGEMARYVAAERCRAKGVR